MPKHQDPAPPYAEDVTDQDMRAAALQYVRKISGFRDPGRP